MVGVVVETFSDEFTCVTSADMVYPPLVWVVAEAVGGSCVLQLGCVPRIVEVFLTTSDEMAVVIRARVV